VTPNAFHFEAEQPLKESEQASDLEYIEIAMRFEFDQHRANAVVDVSGIGQPDEHGHTRYAIDLTPTLLEVLGEIYMK